MPGFCCLYVVHDIPKAAVNIYGVACPKLRQNICHKAEGMVKGQNINRPLWEGKSFQTVL